MKTLTANVYIEDKQILGYSVDAIVEVETRQDMKMCWVGKIHSLSAYKIDHSGEVSKFDSFPTMSVSTDFEISAICGELACKEFDDGKINVWTEK